VSSSRYSTFATTSQLMPSSNSSSALARRAKRCRRAVPRQLDQVLSRFAIQEARSDHSVSRIPISGFGKRFVRVPGDSGYIADHSARPEDGAAVGKTYQRIAEQTLRSEVEAAGFKFVADAAFLRHPEDMRTNIVFRNPTPVDEFVLRFQKPM
jgi:predicted methyltransferase